MAYRVITKGICGSSIGSIPCLYLCVHITLRTIVFSDLNCLVELGVPDTQTITIKMLPYKRNFKVLSAI